MRRVIIIVSILLIIQIASSQPTPTQVKGIYNLSPGNWSSPAYFCDVFLNGNSSYFTAYDLFHWWNGDTEFVINGSTYNSPGASLADGTVANRSYEVDYLQFSTHLIDDLRSWAMKSNSGILYACLNGGNVSNQAYILDQCHLYNDNVSFALNTTTHDCEFEMLPDNGANAFSDTPSGNGTGYTGPAPFMALVNMWKGWLDTNLNYCETQLTGTQAVCCQYSIYNRWGNDFMLVAGWGVNAGGDYNDWETGPFTAEDLGSDGYSIYTDMESFFNASCSSTSFSAWDPHTI